MGIVVEKYLSETFKPSAKMTARWLPRRAGLFALPHTGRGALPDERQPPGHALGFRLADAAHSSQTGEAASKLKQVLTAEEQEQLADGGTTSSEDILAAEMAARADDEGITYVAFTATPKAKTLELFGRRLDPDAPAGEGNLPQPFHVYSMRQAIEEGFILDVLQNYTSYSVAFKLANGGKELADLPLYESVYH